MKNNQWIVATLGILVGCSESTSGAESEAEAEAESESESEGEVLAPEIGTGDHSSESVTFTEIANGDDDGLNTPRDLAFNPMRPDELWVVNRTDESMVIVFDANQDTRTSEKRHDVAAAHFMAKPSSLAFGQDETTDAVGAPGTFATCHESDNGGDYFMGPVLWSSDLDIFAVMNQGGGLGSHLDMLHDSPFCMGIAHQQANIYWVFDGFRNAIDMYDFNLDDGIGHDDHSDGEIYQYVEGEVGYVAGVPSHLSYRGDDAMVYIADSGNGRIAKLDTQSGQIGDCSFDDEIIQAQCSVDDAVISDVVAAGKMLENPSGLEIYNDLIYVTDNANSRFSAFTLKGERVNYLDTGLTRGSLSGFAFGSDGKIYFVDMEGDRVLRIDP